MDRLPPEFKSFVKYTADGSLRAVYSYDADTGTHPEFIRDDVAAAYPERELDAIVESMVESYRQVKRREEFFDSELNGEVEIYDDLVIMVIPEESAEGSEKAAVISLDSDVVEGTNINSFLEKGSELL